MLLTWSQYYAHYLIHSDHVTYNTYHSQLAGYPTDWPVVQNDPLPMLCGYNYGIKQVNVLLE